MKRWNWITKNKVCMGSLVVGIFSIGTVGMFYTTKRDRGQQEEKVMEVTIPQQGELDSCTMSVEPLSSQSNEEKTRKQTDTQQTKVIKDYTVEFQGGIPEETEINANQAVEIGMNWISEVADSSLHLESSKIEMYYLAYGGTVGGGFWKGIVEVDALHSFMFHVSSTTGEILHTQVRTRTKPTEAWFVTKGDGTFFQYIEESQIPAFHKVEIDLNAPMSVSLNGEDEAGLDMYYEQNDYTFTYEVKEDTLYIKDSTNKQATHISKKQDSNNLQVYIPYTVEEVKISLSTGGIFLQDIEANKMQITSQTGSISVEKVKSNQLTIEAQAGSIYLGGGLEGKVKVHTQVGTIFVEEKENSACEYELSSEMDNIQSR